MNIHKKHYLLLLIIVCSIFLLYFKHQNKQFKYTDYDINIEVPYIADDHKINKVNLMLKENLIGEDDVTVIERYGWPDAIRPCYKTLSAFSQVGYTFWYYIHKPSHANENGSVWIRITFDINNSIVSISSSGIQ